MNLSDLSFTKSHAFQLCAIAVVSTGITAFAILGAQEVRRKSRVEKLKKSVGDGPTRTLTDFGIASTTTATSPASSQVLSVEDARALALAKRAQQGDYDNELIYEQLARNRVFLGDAGLEALRDAFVIVVGCGGVGSHAAAALARSGVGRIRLVDFDQVSLSSLNRHAVATLADVGTPKVTTLSRRLLAVAPWIKWDCRNELFSAASAKELLESQFEGKKVDYVIDAIDNIDTKVALLAYCHKHNLRVISAMGAGAKSDPTRIFVGDISTTTDDPLSKSTRVKLRQKGVTAGIPVVFSSEKWSPGKASLLPLAEEEFAKGNVDELGVLQNFRVRIMPVLGTMPAIFGLTVANHVMLELSSYPHEYLMGKSREKMCDGILANLQALEDRLLRSKGLDTVGLQTTLSTKDVEYLVDEIFHGKSVVSGLGTRLILTRWKKPEGELMDVKLPKQKVSTLKLKDLVLMTREEGSRHEKLVLLGHSRVEDVYDKSVLELVDRRLKEEARFEEYR